jgi:transposase-like protein
MEQREKRRQKSRSEMHQKIELWYQSGQSKKEFCETEGLRVHVFDYWRKKYEEKSRGDSSSPSFCEIQPEQGGLISGLRLVYPNGVVVEFRELPDRQYLQSLLRW